MDPDKIIKQVQDPRTNLAALAKASDVSIRALMQMRHSPDANPTLSTLRAVYVALLKMKDEK